MTQHNHIITQHFDDPIGSVVEIDGKCYVKMSDGAHTIDTPINAENKLYFTNINDFKNDTNGLLLCKPKDTPLFTIELTFSHAEFAVINIPAMVRRPTTPDLVVDPIKIDRVICRTTMMTAAPMVTQHQVPPGVTTLDRVMTRTSLYKPRDQQHDQMISKMLDIS